MVMKVIPKVTPITLTTEEHQQLETRNQESLSRTAKLPRLSSTASPSVGNAQGTSGSGRSLRSRPLDARDCGADNTRWRIRRGRLASSDRDSPQAGGRRIAGYLSEFEYTDLMGEFGQQLEHAPPTPAATFNAHFRLAAIHRFRDGQWPHSNSSDGSPVDPLWVCSHRHAARSSQDLFRDVGARLSAG